jgi:hypothetical protein
VQQASFETLCTWAESLPAPQTDVERTVHRRLLARRDELGQVELRKVRPDLADKLEQLRADFDRIVMKAGRRG